MVGPLLQFPSPTNSQLSAPVPEQELKWKPQDSHLGQKTLEWPTIIDFPLKTVRNAFHPFLDVSQRSDGRMTLLITFNHYWSEEALSQGVTLPPDLSVMGGPGHLGGFAVSSGGVAIKGRSLCEVTLCSGILGSFKEVSWDPRVYSQGEKSTFPKDRGFSLQHSCQRCIIDRSVINEWHDRHEEREVHTTRGT